MTTSADLIEPDHEAGRPAAPRADAGDGQRTVVERAQPQAPPQDLQPAADAASAPGGATKSRRLPWLRPVLFALLPLALVGGGIWYINGGQTTSVDDAYVEADKVGVSTDVPGFVKEVDVTENQRVAAGQLLYRLNDLTYQIALQRAEAQLGAIRDELNAQKANYRDLQAQVEQGQNDVAYYGVEYGRQQDLLTAHVASQAADDTAHRNLQTAQQKVASLVQQAAAIAANLDGDPRGSVEKNPRYLQALAERNEAARQLADTVVRAPFAGIATDVSSIAPGKYLPASTTAFYLVSADHVWVDADPKETELTYVRPGQSASVKVDTYPDQHWRGVVQSISPAAAQEFALLPAQNSSGNWVKVVQRIPVRVRVDTTDQSLPPLRAGMSVEVAVYTGHRRGLPHFLTAMFGRR